MNFSELDIRCMQDLLKLPWFDRNEEGKIRFKPGADVTPVYDDHAHLGWSYFFGGVIDHMKDDLPLQYYYDFEKPVPNHILDEQGHPTDAEAKLIEKDIYVIIFRCPPISRTQTVPHLQREMSLFDVRGVVLAPIEVPIRSRHARQTLAACEKANDDRLIPYAAIHPQTPNPEKSLAAQIKRGAKGLKYHPEFQFCAPDHPKALRIFEACEKLKLPVLCHSGCTGKEPGFMQKLAAMEKYEVIFKSFPDLQFVLGHTGIKYVDEAIEYSNKYPQVWLDLAGQTTTQIRSILKRADNDRILYGSDWPFYPMAVTLARTLAALEDFPQSKEKVMYSNMERLLNLKQPAAVS